MKKTLILMAAAASVVLTGCTESDLSNDTSLAKESAPSAIEFSAKARSAGSTRAGVLGGIENTNILKGTVNTVGANESTDGIGFGVIAYNTGATEWANDQTTTTPNFMYNQQVVWNSTTNAWEYNPIKYWPNGKDAANADNSPSNTAREDGVQKLSFFAYAPYVVKSSDLSGVGITKINNSEKAIGTEADGTGNKLAAAPTVDYTLKSSDVHAAANVDLLWGVRGDAIYSETDNDDNTATAGDKYNTSLTKETVPEKVNFLFKHALAKIGGYNGLKIVADIDGNGGGSIGYGALDDKSCITVRQITIQNTATATNYAGVFHLATGAWSDLTGDTPTKGGLFNEDIKDGTSSTIKMNEEIYDADGTVEYTTGSNTWSPLGVTTTAKRVYNTDGQDGFYMIPGASMELEVVINYDVNTYDANINGSYVKTNQIITNTVTLPTTLVSNKFYTLVIHLGLTSVKFSAEVADWDTEDAGKETEIWLPSNVVKYTTAATVAAGANATVNTTAAQTSYTINLTGLKASTNLSVVDKDGTVVTAASQNGSTDGSGNATVDVTLAANSSETATQTGTVTIKGVDAAGKDFTMVVTIIQEKKYTSSTDLALNSNKVVYANAASGTYTINMTGLTASGAYTVTSTDDTNAAVAASGTADGEGKATVSVNLTANTGDTRAFTITIKDTTTGKESSVVINQIHN